MSFRKHNGDNFICFNESLKQFETFVICYVMLYVILCPGLEYNQIYLVSSSFSKFWIHAFLMLHVLDLAGVPLDQIINEHNKINKSNTLNKSTAS